MRRRIWPNCQVASAGDESVSFFSYLLAWQDAHPEDTGATFEAVRAGKRQGPESSERYEAPHSPLYRRTTRQDNGALVEYEGCCGHMLTSFTEGLPALTLQKG